jgi:hypothetical protein
LYFVVGVSAQATLVLQSNCSEILKIQDISGPL